MVEIEVAQGGSPAPSASDRPARRWLVVSISLLVGAVLAWLWSFRLVDSVIGDNIANTLLGYDAKGVPISGVVAGAVFAFVSGLAGTFTACNVAIFGTVTPMMSEQAPKGSKFKQVLRPLGWLLIGMLTVSALYGALGALMGESLPQLSTAIIGNNLPVRLIQSSVVFGLVGLALIYLGLAALQIVPDPLAGLSRRRPNARLVVMGALVGAFLIGRPFPLFFKLFSYAADSHNAFYGALVFVLQSLGNILIVAIVFFLLTWLLGDRYRRWLSARAGRDAIVAAAALIVAGSFTFLYWDLRVPSLFGYGWFPTTPWS